MPPVYRIIEVSLYALLNFLPIMMVALVPFRKNFRFSVPVTTTLVAVICLIQILVGCMVSFTDAPAGLLSLLSTLIYAGFYFVAVKTNIGKLIFTLLMLSNIANLTVTSGKCLEGLLFGQLALEPYRWSFFVCLTITHLIFTLPLFFYFRRIYSMCIAVETKKGFWRYMWAIPATFYMVWYYLLYLSGRSSLENALMPQNTIFLLLLNLGAFLIYHLVIQVVVYYEKASTLERQAHHLAMHKLQYENLHKRINEIRRAKHDLHHHIHLLQDYLREGKLSELESYLESYQASLPTDQALFYCQHYATNALLGYFDQQARTQEIRMDIRVNLPEHINIPETDLSVILGNLLENALEATGQLSFTQRTISVYGTCDRNDLLLEITNPYYGALRQNKSGKYISTKSGNRGLGLDSVYSIIESHKGTMEIETNDQTFRVSIYIPL